MTPTEAQAIRRLDDTQLWQFCVLLEDWSWSVAAAWLALCDWRNEGIEGRNRSAASGSDPTDGICNLFNVASDHQGKKETSTISFLHKGPRRASRRYVH